MSENVVLHMEMQLNAEQNTGRNCCKHPKIVLEQRCWRILLVKVKAAHLKM